MEINRAQQLAKECGYSLKPSTQNNWEWNLYNQYGEWVDTLEYDQIGVLDESDFIQFYLND